MAHKYGDITISVVWEAITDDVPVLFDYCNSILEKRHVMEQQVGEVDIGDEKELKP